MKTGRTQQSTFCPQYLKFFNYQPPAQSLSMTLIVSSKAQTVLLSAVNSQTQSEHPTPINAQGVNPKFQYLNRNIKCFSIGFQ